jgi:hypothetical protein
MYDKPGLVPCECAEHVLLETVSYRMSETGGRGPFYQKKKEKVGAM